MLFPFFIDFSSNSKGNVPFHLIAYKYSCADWDGLHVPWENIFQVGAPAATEFCEYVQVEIYIYIYIHIYIYIYHIYIYIIYNIYISLLVNISSSLTRLPGSQLLVLLPQLIGIIVCLYQQNKPYESKVKFRQASNHYKRDFEAAELIYAN